MKTFAELYDSVKDTLEYQIEELALTFTESVLLRMEELDSMTGKELASRMGSSEAYVSKLLKGRGNFTIETLVKLGRSLDCRVQAPVLIPIDTHSNSARVMHFIRPPKASAANFRPRAVVSNATVEPKNNDDIPTAA